MKNQSKEALYKKAKALVDSGKVSSVSAAAKKAGLSEATYYKYANPKSKAATRGKVLRPGLSHRSVIIDVNGFSITVSGDSRGVREALDRLL